MPTKRHLVALSACALLIASSHSIAYAGTVEQSKVAKFQIAQTSLEKGRKLRKEGKYGEALLALMKAQNNNPQLMDAYYQQALIFKEQKLLKMAASRLEQALAINPDYKKARVLLATIFIEQGNLSDAMNHLGKSMNPSEEKKTDLEKPVVAQKVKFSEKDDLVPAPNTIKKKTEKKKSFWKRKKKKKKRKKKSKHLTRARIRKLIAKRYKKFHKSYKKPRHNKPWYAKYTKLLSFKNPFKFNSPDSQSQIATENQLEQPKRIALRAKAKSLPINSHANSKTSKEDAALDKIFGTSTVQTNDLIAPILTMQDDLLDTKAKKAATTSNTTTTTYKKQKPQSNHVTLNKFPEDNKLLKSKLIEQPPQIKELPDVASITGQEPIKEFELPIKDKWTDKMVFLNKNGTGSLKRGEAFMFSEDTGEAVLFLADGRRIRRIIAPSQNSERIVKLRRPDVLVPKELFYDASLLGKVVAKKNPQSRSLAQKHKRTKTANKKPPTFHMEKLTGESNSLIGTIRDVLRL